MSVPSPYFHHHLNVILPKYWSTSLFLFLYEKIHSEIRDAAILSTEIHTMEDLQQNQKIISTRN